VNRIISQVDDNQKQNQANFTRLTDAVVEIKEATLVQAEMLRNHAEDIKMLTNLSSKQRR